MTAAATGSPAATDFSKGKAVAWTQADLDAIDKAIGSGVQSVRYPDGSQVTYRTQAELEAARSRIAAAISPSTAGSLGNRAFLARF